MGEDMTTGSFGYQSGVTSNIDVLDRTARRVPADYEQGFAKQERELRESRAQIAVLVRQRDELMSLQDVMKHLHVSREDAASRIAALSNRQRQVMDLVLDGRQSKIIAWELGISQRTVENHRAAIMNRTGVRSLPALARLALAAGQCAGM